MVYISNYSISVRDLVICVIVLAAFIALLVRSIRSRRPLSTAEFLGDRILIRNPDLITDAGVDGKDADNMEFEEFEQLIKDQNALSDVTLFYHDIRHWTVKAWSDSDRTTVKIYVTTNQKQKYSLEFSRKTIRNLRRHIPNKEERTWISKIVTSRWQFVIYVAIALFFLYLMFSLITPTLHF